MQPCVYILISLKTGRFYIGSTNNIERRLFEHNSGKTKSLKSQIPLEIVFIHKCSTIIEARQLEYKLKQLKSRKIIKEIVNSGKIPMYLSS